MRKTCGEEMSVYEQKSLYDDESPAEDYQPSCNRTVKVIFVFALANIFAISYVAVDHKLERNKIDAEREMIATMLERLKIPYPASFIDVIPPVQKLKHELEKCEINRNVIAVMQDQMNENKDYLKMWGSVPKPFIHAQIYQARANKKGSDDLMRLRGWNTIPTFTDFCPNQDPVIVANESEWLKINTAGYYYVYSQVTFKCNLPNNGPSQVHSHSITLMKKTFSEITLMENMYQLCKSGGAENMKVSYNGGIFYLDRGDKVSVSVQMPPTTKFFIDVDHQNDDLFFGAYFI